MKEFVCRLCGCGEYHRINGLYQCAECSVKFGEPRNFSLPEIGFVLLDEDAVKPVRAKDGDVGYGAVSIMDGEILSGQTVMFKTGVSIELPPHTEMQVRARSGMAKKHGIMVTNGPGTIDPSYRGPCNVLLTNTGPETYTVKKGDTIAQFLVTTKLPYVFVEVSELSETDRGEEGFGHTGK